jgi:hypothetical protein
MPTKVFLSKEPRIAVFPDKRHPSSPEALEKYYG